MKKSRGKRGEDEAGKLLDDQDVVTKLAREGMVRTATPAADQE